MGGVKQTEVALLKKSQEKAGKHYDTLKSVIDYKASKGKKPKLAKKEYCIKHGKTVPFNMNSPLHLRTLLFKVLKLDPPFPNKKGKTGELSTDAEVLEALEDKHPCVTKLQENRKLSKLHKTYVKGQMKLADVNARVHTDFNQHVTVTGRLSSSHPNLQNIPRANKEIKRAFVVEHDYFILQMDFAQAEFRFWAELSNDRDMISDIASGMDIHRATASQFWGIPEKDVTSEQRSAAKFVVFGLMYGRGAESVAKQVKISTEEAQAIIDQFFAKYPVASRWLRSTKTFVEKRGFVPGYFGRVRRLPYAKMRNVDRQKWGESMRQAVNAPIQGGAADLTGIAMIKIHSELKAHPEWKVHLILTVHDSIILEVHKKDLIAVIKMCRQKMIENVDDMNTAMAADIEVGLNWGDLQSISINNIDEEVVEYLKSLEV
jgi:DNA polymerase-1